MKWGRRFRVSSQLGLGWRIIIGSLPVPFDWDSAKLRLQSGWLSQLKIASGLVICWSWVLWSKWSVFCQREIFWEVGHFLLKLNSPGTARRNSQVSSKTGLRPQLWTVRVRCSAQSVAAPNTSIKTYGSMTLPFEPAPRGFGRSVPEIIRRWRVDTENNFIWEI